MRPPRLVRRSLLALAALALSFALPVFYGGIGVLSRFTDLPDWLLVSAPALMLMAWGFNGARLSVLLRGHGQTIPGRHAYLVAIGSDFGAAAGPPSMAGLASFAFLLRRHHFQTATSTALFTIDKLIDQIFFATILLAGLGGFLLFQVQAVPWALMGVSTLVACGSVAAILMISRRATLALRALAGLLVLIRIGPTIRRRLIRWGLEFQRGIALLSRLSKRRLMLLYLLAAGYWACRFSILPLVAWALKAPVPWPWLLAVQVLVIYAGQLSILPGGTVSVEVTFAALMAPWLDRTSLAFLFLVWRGAIFYWTLVAGGPAFLLAATTSRSSKPADPVRIATHAKVK